MPFTRQTGQGLVWRSALAAHTRTALAAVLTLAGVLAGMRGVGALGPAAYRPLLPLGFVLMALAPWVFLTPVGRTQMGLVWPRSRGWVLVGAATSGALLALLIGVLGSVWFGATAQNWYVSVLSSFQNSFDTAGKPIWLLFVAFTAPAMIFSPLGEEIFFRGFLQRALQDSMSERLATHLECGFFALVHLCHHGLHWQGGALALWWPSALVWVLLMYGAARMFAHWRARAASVWAAVVSHMAFNVAMGIYLFAALTRLPS